EGSRAWRATTALGRLVRGLPADGQLHLRRREPVRSGCPRAVLARPVDLRRPPCDVPADDQAKGARTAFRPGALEEGGCWQVPPQLEEDGQGAGRGVNGADDGVRRVVAHAEEGELRGR